MTIELADNGYGNIMDQIQKLEDLAWEGIFPERIPDERDLPAYRKFQDIVSESKKLRLIIQENLLTVPNTAGPEGPRAA